MFFNRWKRKRLNISIQRKTNLHHVQNKRSITLLDLQKPLKCRASLVKFTIRDNTASQRIERHRTNGKTSVLRLFAVRLKYANKLADLSRYPLRPPPPRTILSPLLGATGNPIHVFATLGDARGDYEAAEITF